MDLLLVNAGGFRKKVYQELSKDYSAIEPPFWAALTAAFIRNKGFNASILDANAENLDIEETAKKIEELNPKLVNIVVYGQHPSASTALMGVVGNLCREIKKLNPSRKIILTGLHPSALPEKTLREEACDFVCEGEGFYTILDLLQNKNNKEILGLWYRENNEIKHNARAPLILDLDNELPDVAWDLLPMDKYKAHNWHCLNDLNSRNSYASISTSLGCPFNCSFCCINAPFGKSYYRCWSPEWVLRQLDILVNNYKIKNIKFIDELFVFNPSHFITIANKIIERNYKLNIWCYARVDTTKEEYLKVLKQAGFNWFGLGIESGDDVVRKGVSKGRFEDENIRDVVKKIRNAGIYVAANYIFGLPEDTLESMQKTLDLATELNCEWANMYCTMAYPGSRLHKEAVENKITLPEDNSEIGWLGYSQHSYETFPLPTKTLSPMQVLKFRDEAFMKYFTSEKYLKMIEEKFGKQAREHLENMTTMKLRRKLLEN